MAPPPFGSETDGAEGIDEFVLAVEEEPPPSPFACGAAFEASGPDADDDASGVLAAGAASPRSALGRGVPSSMISSHAGEMARFCTRWRASTD